MKPIALFAGCLWAVLSLPGILSAAKPNFFARRDYPEPGYAIASADTNGDGIPDLLVTPYEGFGVMLGNGDGTFRSGPSLSLPGIQVISSVTPVDLNGDGKVDVVLATGAIIVLFGNGDGSFGGKTTYSVSDSVYGSVVGDFNGDGIPDIAAAGGKGMWFFAGKGGGLFDAGVLTPFNANGLEIAAADFNGDGRLDLALTTSTGIAVLLGNGDGTFVVEPYTAAGASLHLAVGDLNGDGHPDIAAQISGSSYVYLYFGNGTGGFSGPQFADLDSGGAIRIGDVNGDGIPDLISDGVEIALGTGNGKFRQPVYYPVASTLGTYAMTVGQLTSNGHLDIVVQNTNVLSVLLNTGKGRFADGLYVPVENGVGCAVGADIEVAADFNLDGKPDLAVCNSQGITILLGTGKAESPFTTGTSVPVTGGGSIWAFQVGDFNGDGIPDLLVSTSGNGDGGAVFTYLGKGDGTFTLKGSTSVPGVSIWSSYVVTGDFNGDGKLDFATSGNVLALGNGDGTFQPPVTLVPQQGGFTYLGAADLNNDGYPDLVLTNFFSSNVYVMLNDQHGGFQQAPIIQLGQDANYGITFGDLNGDGNLDVLISLGIGGQAVYLGDGKGGFTLKPSLLDGMGGDSAIVADLNGDGIPDVGIDYYGCIAILLGKGDGTFKSPYYLGTGPGGFFFIAENLHGQAASSGLADIVVNDGGGVRVLINRTAQ
jgi:hypothetical protein